MIKFSVNVETSLSPGELFDEFFRVENWHSFKGYGPVPGIHEVEMVGVAGSKIGTKFKVLNTDGSSHEETVVEFEANKNLVMKMDTFSKPLNRLASHFVEKWHVEVQGVKTHVERSFELYPKNLAGEVVLRIISLFLKRAVDIHTRQLGNSGSG